MSPPENLADQTAAGGMEPKPAYDQQRQNGRFKTGQSGNPEGRPREVARQSKPLSPSQRALAEEIAITGRNGKKGRITASDAVARRMLQNAVQGDAAMMKLLLTQNPEMITAVPDDAAGDGPAFMKFLASTLSDGALREFRDAMAEWARLKGEGP